MNLTTREIAVLIWLMAGLGWILTRGTLRSGLLNVVKATLNGPVLILFGFIALWTVLEVWFLAMVGLWTGDHLKETLLWYTLTAVVGIVSSVSKYKEPDYKKATVDGFKIVVIVELVGGLTTFPLLVELAIVPVVAVIGATSGYVHATSGSVRAEQFLESVLVLLGLVVLGAAGIRAWSDISIYANWSTMRTFLIPPALSLLFIPAAFWISLYFRYEWLFLKLKGSRWFRTYARIRLLMLLGPRPRQVLEFGRRHAFVLPQLRTVDELRALLREES